MSLFVSKSVKEKGLSWNMVYILQTPLMLMSWAWVMFFTGLACHVSRVFFAKPVRTRDDKRVRDYDS